MKSYLYARRTYQYVSSDNYTLIETLGKKISVWHSIRWLTLNQVTHLQKEQPSSMAGSFAVRLMLNVIDCSRSFFFSHCAYVFCVGVPYILIIQHVLRRSFSGSSEKSSATRRPDLTLALQDPQRDTQQKQASAISVRLLLVKFTEKAVHPLERPS